MVYIKNLELQTEFLVEITSKSITLSAHMCIDTEILWLIPILQKWRSEYIYSYEHSFEIFLDNFYF